MYTFAADCLEAMLETVCFVPVMELMLQQTQQDPPLAGMTPRRLEIPPIAVYCLSCCVDEVPGRYVIVVV